jgi:hypothetical protein
LTSVTIDDAAVNPAALLKNAALDVVLTKGDGSAIDAKENLFEMVIVCCCIFVV